MRKIAKLEKELELIRKEIDNLKVDMSTIQNGFNNFVDDFPDYDYPSCSFFKETISAKAFAWKILDRIKRLEERLGLKYVKLAEKNAHVKLKKEKSDD